MARSAIQALVVSRQAVTSGKMSITYDTDNQLDHDDDEGPFTTEPWTRDEEDDEGDEVDERGYGGGTQRWAVDHTTGNHRLQGEPNLGWSVSRPTG